MTTEVFKPPARLQQRTGRPSKLTPEFTTIIVNAISSGMSLKAAALLGGVHPFSLSRYMGRGRKALADHEERISKALNDNPALADTVQDLGDLDTEESDEDRVFREFCDAVHRAGALARGVAEAEVFRNDKLAWLRFSPQARLDGERPWGRQDQVEVADPGGNALGTEAVAMLMGRLEVIASRKKDMDDLVMEIPAQQPKAIESVAATPVIADESSYDDRDSDHDDNDSQSHHNDDYDSEPDHNDDVDDRSAKKRT